MPSLHVWARCVRFLIYIILRHWAFTMLHIFFIPRKIPFSPLFYNWRLPIILLGNSLKAIYPELLTHIALGFVLACCDVMPDYSALSTHCLLDLRLLNDLGLSDLFKHTHTMRISVVLLGHIGSCKHFASGLTRCRSWVTPTPVASHHLWLFQTHRARVALSTSDIHDCWLLGRGKLGLLKIKINFCPLYCFFDSLRL